MLNFRAGIHHLIRIGRSGMGNCLFCVLGGELQACGMFYFLFLSGPCLVGTLILEFAACREGV